MTTPVDIDGITGRVDIQKWALLCSFYGKAGADFIGILDLGDDINRQIRVFAFEKVAA